VHGLASAWLLLGWGARTCLLPPRQACPAVAAAFALYGLVTFCLQDVPDAVVVALAPAMPVTSGVLLALSFGRDVGNAQGFARAHVNRDALRGLNYGAVALLALCAVVCSMTNVFITPAQSVLVRYTTNVFRVVVFAAIAALVFAWVLVLRRDDPDRLWPLYAAVVFFGLLGYSAFSLLDDVASVSFMNATQECLMMFAWMFVSGAAHRHGLPELVAFGVGALLFMRTDLPAAVLSLLAPSFAQACAAAGATASVAAAFVMAAALIVYTIALLMRSALRAERELHEVGTVGGAADGPRIAGGTDRPSPGTNGIEGTGGKSGADGSRPAVPRDMLDAYGLSEREAQVAELLLRGYSLPQVGERIGISLNTVRYHAKGVYRKLGIHSKAELVTLAEEWGMR
jgi:DNA-binding CsgD family transcriptional regulator